ncbi:MAG: SDR family oxidoreductase [Ruminococcaceae bacterium]|nr:SDR family oxidoreductase [Oscillospiraceae bacterium]
MPKALITGASSGIGASIAKRLSAMGYETILVARRKDRLEELKKELPSPSVVVAADLTDMSLVKSLAKDFPDIDILVNNAGFGVYGEFTETDFDREDRMIDVNIRALHYLMKEYIPLMEKRGGGKILNVASSAAFFSGPFLSSYYASKAYVLKLSRAIREELRRRKSPVTISVLCPGPVETEFGEVSGSNLGKKTLSADYVAKVSLSGLMKGKGVIVPGFTMKCSRILSKIAPESLTVRMLYRIQKSKKKTN